MARADVTVREVSMYEAGIEAGKIEERIRARKLLVRAKVCIRLGCKRSAIRLIDRAMKKEPTDAGE